jgi:hypothetical protein
MSMHKVWWVGVAVAGMVGVGRASPTQGGSTDEGNPKNGLSNDSFLRNAVTTNERSLRHLLDHALTDALFGDPYFARQLHDPHGRAAMAELVSCALDDSTYLTYVDPLTSATHRFTGELGLCHRDNEVGDWSRNPPTRACQELVTACMAARVNAVGESVPLSLRGGSMTNFTLLPAVPQEKRFREPSQPRDPVIGALIGSFNWPTCVLGRECGWMPAHVGKLRYGEQARLVITDPARCAMRIRVCAGIHGCIDATSGWTPPPGFDDGRYSKWVTEKPNACVSSPVLINYNNVASLGGYYSVMVLPPATRHVVPPITNLGEGAYPADEASVFTFREGAFYGNLFEPHELKRNCEVPVTDPEVPVCIPTDNTPMPPDCEKAGGYSARCPEPHPSVPYRHVYACFSAPQAETSTDDRDGIQYLNARMCDVKDPDFRCFPHQPVRCFYADEDTNEHRGAHCDRVNGVYLRCEGRDDDDRDLEYRPITTYLNAACDLIDPDSDLCGKLGRNSSNGARLVGEDAAETDSGSCSSSRSCGVLLGVLVALLRRRRPRAGSR